MNGPFANLLLHGADAVSRVRHLLFTAPLAYAGLLPVPHPLVPSKSSYIVVTGASTGIGREAARALREAGFSVWAGVRKTADADSVRADGLIPLIIDVADDASVERASSEVRAALAKDPGSRLVAVVANAGVGGDLGPVECLPINDVKSLFEVNVFGAVRTVNAFLPLIREAKGRVLLVGSVVGFETNPGIVPYCMTKHALESLADGLRRELAPLGVAVSLLEPGPVLTHFVGKTAVSKVDVEDKIRVAYKSTYDFIDLQHAGFPAVAAPPSFSSNAVVHAVTASFPLYRYRVTWPAYFLSALKMLPTQIGDLGLYLIMSKKSQM